MTENEVKALLCRKYAPPVYAFFTEVGTSTGSAARYIDAVAYSLYASSQHEIHGFEIKVSRSDFMNEMKNPEKSDDAMQYFNRWWLVAPKGIAHKDELPKSWGFYEVVNGKLYNKKPAPELDAAYSLSFVAAMLRRATENTVPRSTLYDQIDTARAESKVEYAKDIEESKEKLAKYIKKVEDFEGASGIRVFDYWKDGKEIGDAVDFVLRGGLQLNYEISGAIQSVESILKDLNTFDSIRKKFPKIK